MILSAKEYRDMSSVENLSPDDKELESLLDDAEEDINIMTYGRIAVRGFDALTTFQQEKIKKAVARQADFREEYSDLLSNPLSSYSINGTSMGWEKENFQKFSGVYTNREVIGVLNQTGLTYRGVY